MVEADFGVGLVLIALGIATVRPDLGASGCSDSEASGLSGATAPE
jgi:hypothetical protein